MPRGPVARAGTFFLLFAAAWAFVALGFGLPAWQNDRNWPKVEAKVIRLDYEGRAYYPVFEYTAPDGRVMHARGDVGSRPPSYRVGETALIAVNPARPTQVVTTGSLGLLAVSGGLSAIFAAVGGALLGSAALRARREQRARQEGEPGWGSVIAVRQDRWRVSGRNPWVIDVEWESPAGEKIVLTSARLWADPTGSLPPDRRLPLKVIASDPRRYHWIDLGALSTPRA